MYRVGSILLWSMYSYQLYEIVYGIDRIEIHTINSVGEYIHEPIEFIDNYNFITDIFI